MKEVIVKMAHAVDVNYDILKKQCNYEDSKAISGGHRFVGKEGAMGRTGFLGQ